MMRNNTDTTSTDNISSETESRLSNLMFPFVDTSPWMPGPTLVSGSRRSKDRSNARLGHKEKVIKSRRIKNKNAKMARKRNRH